jgi:hypothetical protein
MALFRLNQLERLKRDYTDGLVDIEAVAADTAKISIMRYNERTGERVENRSEEVNISDIDEAIADAQDKLTMLGQLKTVVTNALDNYTG